MLDSLVSIWDSYTAMLRTFGLTTIMAAATLIILVLAIVLVAHKYIARVIQLFSILTGLTAGALIISSMPKFISSRFSDLPGFVPGTIAIVLALMALAIITALGFKLAGHMFDPSASGNSYSEIGTSKETRSRRSLKGRLMASPLNIKKAIRRRRADRQHNAKRKAERIAFDADGQRIADIQAMRKMEQSFEPVGAKPINTLKFLRKMKAEGKILTPEETKTLNLLESAFASSKS